QMPYPPGKPEERMRRALLRERVETKDQGARLRDAKTAGIARGQNKERWLRRVQRNSGERSGIRRRKGDAHFRFECLLEDGRVLLYISGLLLDVNDGHNRHRPGQEVGTGTVTQKPISFLAGNRLLSRTVAQKKIIDVKLLEISGDRQQTE